MSKRCNRKYEDEICPSEVAHRLVLWNKKVNLERFCDTFKCGTAIAKRCFAHVGLLHNPQFKDQVEYDLLFGKGEFEKRTALKSNNTAQKRQYASMSHDDDMDEQKGYPSLVGRSVL